MVANFSCACGHLSEYDTGVPDDLEPARAADTSDLRLLLNRAGVRRASDLDLLIFFGRHPRSLLSSESLSAFLGYDIKQIANSLDKFLAAGLLRRRQTSAHSARLYELILDGPSSYQWLEELLAIASTRPGRMALLDEIERGSAAGANEDVSGPHAATSGPRRLTRAQSATKASQGG